MNATPHAIIGYSVMKLVGGNPLGCLLAFVSHLLADYIGESNGIRNTKERIVFDFIPTLICFIFAFIFGGLNEVYLMFLGSLFGNLPDLIDKKLYLSIFFPKKIKSTQYFHWQKVIFTPKPEMTRYLGYYLVTIILLINLIQIQ